MTDAALARRKTPWHLWGVGGLSLLWNAGGGFDFVMTLTDNEAYMGQFTPEQRTYFTTFPFWLILAWGVAVWSAIAGSILLLLRSRWAEPAFWLSLVAMLVTAAHNYLLSETSMLELVGPFALIFSAAIVLVTLALIYYARRMNEAGYLA